MADTEKENSSAESKKKSAMLDEDFGKKSSKCADSNASDCSFKHVKNQDSRSNSKTRTDAIKDLENKKPLMPSHQNGSSTESIDRDPDHQGWLQLKKRKRREIPEERKRRRLGHRGKPSQAVGATKLPQSVSSCRRDQDKNGVSLFFRKHEFPLIMSHWQIIQLVSSTHPGRFFAWVIADGIMNKISITVPRVFYLNSKTPVTEEFPGRRVNKILPHSRPIFNLTEICIDEDLFRAESRKLDIHLAVPEVEGIYETKVPLEFNAILQIGCV
ncbi:DNA polymerase epsilon catalytic subunit A-like, partial [Asparagus officinalis]